MNDEYELNFIKIDSDNNIKLIGTDDLELEMLDLMTCVSPFEMESIDGILLKFFRQFIPKVQDLVQTNIELIKKNKKLTHPDKKTNLINDSINRILSTDFKDTFIFNKTNIEDVYNILSNSFLDIKKYKISSYDDLKEALKKLKFEKYKIDKLYFNNDYLKNKMNINTSRNSSIRSASTFPSSFATIKELNDEASELDDNTQKYTNRYFNKPLEITYIDNNIKNIINSSILTSDYNYNEEEVSKKLLTKECFSFQKNNKDEGELPIELIILLYKLKNVKTLIYQINNIDEKLSKMAILIFLNIKWLFMSEIQEVKFDLGNEILQKGILEVFNERSSEIYYNFQKIKNATYYNGSYKARTINCWEPEGDIFFEKREENQNNKKINYIYSNQSNTEGCYFDNQLCNIYDEYGHLTNLKYIRPIIYTLKKNDKIYDQSLEEFEYIDNFINNENYRVERESVYVSSNSSFNSKNSELNQLKSQNTINNTNTITTTERTTPILLKEFVKKHLYSFQMVAFYSFFFKDLKKIKKLGLYFHSAYSFEIQLMIKLFDISYDRFHFLIFTNVLDSLTEAEFSFNSLDNKSFENILGIINKNSNLTSIKMSFFSPDINYFENSLFNIWSTKKLSIRKLFTEQKEILINCTGDKERDMNYFILNHNKFVDSFEKNLRKFFNLLKFKSVNYLEELILRFDIPLTILNSERYIILLVKFIINLLIMITFQDNRIHTLKLIAPELSFDTVKMPYIRQLFKEIILEGEQIDEKWEQKLKSEKKRKEKMRIKEKEKELKEQREREDELRGKNARKDILENISNLSNCPPSLSNKEIAKVVEGKEKGYQVDVDENIENYHNKRFKSVYHKKKFNINEKESRRKETINSEKLLIEQRRQLNKNDSLENLTIQFKIYDLPELFNICLMNNLIGLKTINLGYLDEITFISFLKDYKFNLNKLENLTSLKISLCSSIIYYNNLEKYIIEYINTNSPKLEEKFLFSDLKIFSEQKMEELVELVYFQAEITKLVVQLGNDNDNTRLLPKVINKRIQDRRTGMLSMIILMDLPEFKKLYSMNIIKCLASFYSKKKNRAILCKENPNNTN